MNKYHLYAQDCADYPRIIGFQVQRPESGECWADRADNAVLEHTTALDHFRAASQSSDEYRLCAVHEGDLDEPTFETPVEEAQPGIVGFQVRDKNGHYWEHCSIEVLAFTVAMEYWQEALKLDAQAQWQLIVVHEGEIQDALFLTNVVDPRF